MKKLMLLALLLTLWIVSVASAGVGSIKISPAWPIMQASPADFDTWVEGGSGDAHELHVLIVMTEDCWNDLSGDVQVYDGTTKTIAKTDFVPVTDNSEIVPPGMTAGYTVASLKEHLSYGLSVPLSSGDTIYYNLTDAPIDDPLTGTPQEFTVDVPTSDSSKTRALVYVMGSSVEDPVPFDLDMRVPPTPAGFVVPEPATIAAVATSLGALGLYAYRRKRKP